MKIRDHTQKDTKETDTKNLSKMAYSKNEKKLKEFLSKQDDSIRTRSKVKSNTGSPSNDPNIRRG